MSEAEIKDLCMEWYLLYGERGTMSLTRNEEYKAGVLFDRGLVQWMSETTDGIFRLFPKITPKALELIKS